MCRANRAEQRSKERAPTCTLARATFAGGALSLLGCGLSIASALLPWVQCPLASCCAAEAACAAAFASALGASGGTNSTAAALATLTLAYGDPYLIGLIAPCKVVSKVPACARFDESAFSPTPSGQGAAALLIMGFVAGLMGFLASCIAGLGCCLGPRMLRFRFSVALLALLCSGAGAVVGGAFLAVPGGTLADLLKAHFAWVGSGLGVAIAGTLLQLFALLVVVGTCCCQPKARAPLSGAGAEGGAAAPPRGGKKGGKGREEGGGGDAEEGRATVTNPLSGAKKAEKGAEAAALPAAAANPFRELDADGAKGAYERAKADYDEVGKEELLAACRALQLEGAGTKKGALALLETHFKGAAKAPAADNANPFKEEGPQKPGAVGNPFKEGDGAAAAPAPAGAKEEPTAK